jgi:hypothetical protein
MGILRASYTTNASSGDGISTSTHSIYGKVIKVVRNPTDTHTASWDCTVADENAVTLTTNTACSATATETDRPTLVNTYFLPVIAGTPKLTIAAAGNSKSGVVDIYYRW